MEIIARVVTDAEVVIQDDDNSSSTGSSASNDKQGSRRLRAVGANQVLHRGKHGGAKNGITFNLGGVGEITQPLRDVAQRVDLSAVRWPGLREKSARDRRKAMMKRARQMCRDRHTSRGGNSTPLGGAAAKDVGGDVRDVIGASGGPRERSGGVLGSSSKGGSSKAGGGLPDTKVTASISAMEQVFNSLKQKLQSLSNDDSIKPQQDEGGTGPSDSSSSSTQAAPEQGTIAGSSRETQRDIIVSDNQRQQANAVSLPDSISATSACTDGSGSGAQFPIEGNDSLSTASSASHSNGTATATATTDATIDADAAVQSFIGEVARSGPAAYQLLSQQRATAVLTQLRQLPGPVLMAVVPVSQLDAIEQHWVKTQDC